jgi:hypothetical protein
MKIEIPEGTDNILKGKIKNRLKDALASGSLKPFNNKHPKGIIIKIDDIILNNNKTSIAKGSILVPGTNEICRFNILSENMARYTDAKIIIIDCTQTI